SLRITPTQNFDFEAPVDADHDNVYRFQVGIPFQGSTGTAAVAITVTDVLDGITATGTAIEGEAINQFFGVPLSAIPDVTGDGKPELGVSLQYGPGSASAYVVGSEFFSAMPGTRLSVANLGNTGAKFSQTPSPTSRRANFLSAQPAATGVDLLY